MDESAHLNTQQTPCIPLTQHITKPYDVFQNNPSSHTDASALEEKQIVLVLVCLPPFPPVLLWSVWNVSRFCVFFLNARRKTHQNDLEESSPLRRVLIVYVLYSLLSTEETGNNDAKCALIRQSGATLTQYRYEGLQLDSSVTRRAERGSLVSRVLGLPTTVSQNNVIIQCIITM